jgi:hypothetical protein
VLNILKTIFAPEYLAMPSKALTEKSPAARALLILGRGALHLFLVLLNFRTLVG